MEVIKKVIDLDGRKVNFFGTVENNVMSVLHMVDPSRSRMYVFMHAGYRGKTPETEFDTAFRNKVLATAKAKHGIGKALAFANYICELDMIPDEDGDYTFDIVDMRSNRRITRGFYDKHWGAEKCLPENV